MSTATLNWVLPTTRTDGSALAMTDIASVEIFDAVNGAATTQIGTATGAATTFTTPVLGGGSHVFTVVVVDTAGDDSAPSAPATLSITVAPPNPATGLTATLNP